MSTFISYKFLKLCILARMDIGFVRAVQGLTRGSQVRQLISAGVEQTHIFVVGETCESFVEAVSTLRPEHNDRIVVVRADLIADKGYRYKKLNEAVSLLIDGEMAIYVIETGKEYRGEVELLRMQIEALGKREKKNRVGRPSIQYTPAQLQAAQAIWHDVRYSTNGEAVEAMNSSEHEIATGSKDVKRWTERNAFNRFKASGRFARNKKTDT